jgi:hypothetical protein
MVFFQLNFFLVSLGLALNCLFNNHKELSLMYILCIQKKGSFMRGDKKTEVLIVRMSLAEKENLLQAAQQFSINASDLARLSIREAIQRGSISLVSNNSHSHNEIVPA